MFSGSISSRQSVERKKSPALKVRGLVGATVAMATVTGWLAGAAELHVAPDGDDRNPGTRAQPLATLERARDAARRSAPAGAVTVNVRAGTYYLSTPLAFTAADSGTESAPITWLAERGALVRITGGREVTGWMPVKDQAVLGRLTPEARGKVVVADLRTQGIVDFGQLRPRGFGTGNPVAEAELFYDDAPMSLARWPNAGFQGVRSKEGDQTVIVNTNRVGRWQEEHEPWVFAYWHHDWAEVCEPLAGVDAAKPALLRTAQIKAVYGVTPNRARWYAFNLLAELDQPGEYYLDRRDGLLYFWPPAPGGSAVLSMAEGLIRADGLSHVRFQGFTFEACRGTAVVIREGRDCRVVGCTVRNTGRQGVEVSQGEQHEVYGCDVAYTGSGGIHLSGGQRVTLTPARHSAENNHVHHYARRARTYHPAITVSGVGNRIAHNLIHDGPHMALSAGGNDHVVEYNEIHNVVEESGDAGAYYVGRDWTQRGNLLRHNYFHNIVGATGYGGMTLYLDDQHGGHTIHGNLFERCMQAVFIGGGDDNLVTNNVFVNSVKSAHLDNRGMQWQKPATDNPKGELRTRLRAMPYTNALWRARYPGLANLPGDDPGVPKRNVFVTNISAGGRWDDISNAVRHLQSITNNLVFDRDPDWVRLIKDPDGRPVRMEFKNPTAVMAIGFEPLPLERMGLYADPRRASWPVRRAVRPVAFP